MSTHPDALTAVVTGWVRNPVSAASVEEPSTKKRLRMIDRTRCFRRAWSSWWSHCAQLPGAWNELNSAFQFCPIFSNYQPTYRLANCAGSMSPRWWVPPAWARGPSKRRGWWLICWGLLFSSAKYSAQFVPRPLKEPFLCDEFDSHIFSSLLLHTFQYIFQFLVPRSWRWGWSIQIFAKCS